MTRVSLKEAYDNKDVVAQIYAIRDTAESAEDTAEQAVTTANTASDHVDALVPQVEGAVQNANSASASAQASAQTVAGYENRLATAESDIDGLESDVDTIEGNLNAVTLRVTTAEGNIVTIQGRVTALETADGQNVKINRINDYAVGLTGNQRASGSKIWVGNTAFSLEGDAWRASLTFPSAKKSDTTTEFSGWFRFMAGDPTDSGEIGRLEYDMMSNGHRRIRIFVVSPSGQYVAKTLLEIDANGGIIA